MTGALMEFSYILYDSYKKKEFRWASTYSDVPFRAFITIYAPKTTAMTAPTLKPMFTSPETPQRTTIVPMRRPHVLPLMGTPRHSSGVSLSLSLPPGPFHFPSPNRPLVSLWRSMVLSQVNIVTVAWVGVHWGFWVVVSV